MEAILFVMVFAFTGASDGGAHVETEQILFSDMRACEKALEKINDAGNAPNKTRAITFVKTACIERKANK